MPTKTKEELRVELKASEARNRDVFDTYQAFVLWVVNRLKPSGMLPPLTDEAYAKQLIEELITEKDEVQRAFVQEENKWTAEKKELLANEKALKQRIGEMEKTIKLLSEELRELKTALTAHSREIADVVEEKTFLTTIKGLFTKRKKALWTNS